MPLLAAKILVGFVVGVLIGMSGVGGGVLLLPILIFGLKVPPIMAVGSDALFNFFTKIPASLLHLKKGTVRRKVVIALAVGSIPGSICGVKLLMYIRHVYGDGVNSFIKTAVGRAAHHHSDAATVPEENRRAGRQSPTHDQEFHGHGGDWPGCGLSGGHDLGGFGQHHHDVAAAVLQLPAEGKRRHRYRARCHPHRSHGIAPLPTG